MPNIRILHDNAADAATLAASSTAGSLEAANLLTDIKSQVWRSTGTTATLTLTWDDPRPLNMVVLGFSNLTAQATMRARVYQNEADSDPLVDSGALAACGYAPLGLFEWGAEAPGRNAYTVAGLSYGRVYFPAAAGRKLVIDIADADNPAGYVQAGRLIAGAYWSPKWNASSGAQQTIGDLTKNERNDAGDLRSSLGPKFNSLRLDLELLEPIDRARVWDILRGNGFGSPLFISLFPEDADPRIEQSHQLWGKLSKVSSITAPYCRTFAAPLEFEEI